MSLVVGVSPLPPVKAFLLMGSTYLEPLKDTRGWEKSNPKNLEEWVRTLRLEWANHGCGWWPTLDILVKPDNRKWHCILAKENDGQDWIGLDGNHPPSWSNPWSGVSIVDKRSHKQIGFPVPASRRLWMLLLYIYIYMRKGERYVKLKRNINLVLDF